MIRSSWQKTSFGLLEPQGDLEVVEPSQIDLIHVPGLAFLQLRAIGLDMVEDTTTAIWSILLGIQ